LLSIICCNKNNHQCCSLITSPKGGTSRRPLVFIFMFPQINPHIFSSFFNQPLNKYVPITKNVDDALQTLNGGIYLMEGYTECFFLRVNFIYQCRTSLSGYDVLALFYYLSPTNFLTFLKETHRDPRPYLMYLYRIPIFE
jgi:hypothetical protein